MGLQQRSSSLAKSLVQDVLPETGTSTVIIYSSTAFYGIQQSIWCFFCKVNSQMVEKVWSFAATPCSMHLSKVCSCVCCCIFGAGLTSQTLIFGRFAVVLCRWRSLFKEALVFFFRSVKRAGNLWTSESACFWNIRLVPSTSHLGNLSLAAQRCCVSRWFVVSSSTTTHCFCI